MNERQRVIFILFAGLVAFSTQIIAVETNHWEIQHDIEYARVGDLSLKLDLYMSQRKARAPLIVWVHGGAWRSGSKKSMPLTKLVEDGYPTASVDYRLSTQAKFPAQVHDIKAAIRFLRGHGEQWHLPTKNILVAGESAGGHLAALVGVSNPNHYDLKGK
jgi:acetyl esterase/lipase